jgi:Probable zinc-ribbon domain
MKSGKQRRQELKIQRQARQEKQEQQKQAKKLAVQEAALQAMTAQGTEPVDRTALAPHNSYDEPDFVKRGYYLDHPFTCAGCCRQEVWTAKQQKWWYEVAKGSVFSTAKFCRTCRHQEQDRREEARRIQQEGVMKKCKPPLT